MKAMLMLLLSVFCLPLCADSDENLICDKSPNCPVCKKKRDELAMNGDRVDNRLSDEVNRAADSGNTEREQQLENREQNADLRQEQRQNNESIRTDGRR